MLRQLSYGAVTKVSISDQRSTQDDKVAVASCHTQRVKGTRHYCSASCCLSQFILSLFQSTGIWYSSAVRCCDSGPSNLCSLAAFHARARVVFFFFLLGLSTAQAGSRLIKQTKHPTCLWSLLWPEPVTVTGGSRSRSKC